MLKKIGWGFLVLLGLLIIGAFISYFVVGSKDLALSDEVRMQAPGQFADLTDGKIHYVWVEPEPQNANGEIVVMGHGLYVPHFMFAKNAQGLSEAGYRVLMYDHFGHGYSDRPTRDYNAALFNREVGELLQAVEINQPVILAGQSMGGLISARFAATHPEKVKKLVLFVPAGLALHGREKSFAATLLRTPLIGEWIWRMLARKALTSPWKPACDVCGKGKLLGDAHIQTKYKGYFPAMLNILRHFNLRDQDTIYAQLESNGTDVLAFFGQRDTTVHIDSAERLAAAVPSAKIIVMENGDHALNIRHWQEVNTMLLAELSGAEQDAQ